METYLASWFYYFFYFFQIRLSRKFSTSCQFRNNFYSSKCTLTVNHSPGLISIKFIYHNKIWLTQFFKTESAHFIPHVHHIRIRMKIIIESKHAVIVFGNWVTQVTADFIYPFSLIKNKIQAPYRSFHQLRLEREKPICKYFRNHTSDDRRFVTIS